MITKKPKLVLDLPAEKYHAGPEISSTFMKRMLRSPAHAQFAAPVEPTPLMLFGTAWHAHFFEPEKFQDEYAVVPSGIDKRTKDGREFFNALEEEGKTPIKQEDLAKLERMSENAHRLVHSRKIFRKSEEFAAECSIYAEFDGVEIRIRPDLLVFPCPAFPHGMIVDGKTCTDASPIGFGKHAWNNAFYIQAALYAYTVARLFDLEQLFAPFYWLSVEREAPHCALYHRAPENLLQYGLEEVSRLLTEVKVCRETRIWPGYSEDHDELILPSYAIREIEGGGELTIEEME